MCILTKYGACLTMKLNAQQIAFFDVFGYLVLPKVFNEEEIAAMSKDFEALALADRDGKEFDADRRQNISVTETESWHNIEVRDQLFYPLVHIVVVVIVVAVVVVVVIMFY